jgi:hypothetical protein
MEVTIKLPHTGQFPTAELADQGVKC